METDEFVLQARIDAKILDVWLEAGWLVPHRDEGEVRYSEIDLARAHLINDLGNLGVNDAGVPIILDLIDQLHGLRRLLREVLSAADSQEPQVEPR
ncbi:MAG TPA: MerR family transcriptional regulator [Xanthobacteraceae bacterium]|jgi:chaperone modulatory protein CbpM